MSRYNDVPNLLEEHPEGLGKHIEVYQLNPPGYTVDGYFFKDNINNDRLPFMFSHDTNVFLVILGSDLVHHIPDEFDVSWAMEKININLKHYVDQIWKYLNLNPRSLYIQPIGWQQ